MSLNVYDAKFQINAGVVGTDAIEKFGNKLGTVGKTADNVNKQMASLSRTFNTLLGGFAIDRLVGIGMEFARTTIQVDAFQKQLSVGFGSASTFELEKLRNTMRELGISQDEALGSAVRFTSALKLSGQSMAEANTNFEAASKLILSNKLSAEGAQRVYYALAQIASKGKLMSEELNGQLGDTLAGFTQQVAIAMGKSTAELLKSMQDGKVSAEQFFEALQKIGGGIDEGALDSAARSLGNVKNAIFDFQSSVFKSQDVKAALDLMASGVNFVRENLDTITFAAKTAAVAIGVNFLLSLKAVKTAIIATRIELVTMGTYWSAYGAGATIAATASINAARAMTVLRGAASGLYAALGGGLGIALIAITAGFMQASQSASVAEDHLRANAEAAKVLGIQLGAASQKALLAATEQRGLGSSAQASEPLIWSFKNSVDGLTASLWEQAKAARAARVEMLQQQSTEAWRRVSEARNDTWAGSRELSRRSDEALAQGDISRSFSLGMQSIGSDVGNLFSWGRQGREASVNEREARRQALFADAQIEILRNSPIGKSDLPNGGRTPDGGTGSGGGGGSGGKSRTGSSGPSVVQIEKTYNDQLNTILQEDLRARRELSTTAEQRAADERAALASEVQDKLASIAAAKGLSGAQRFSLQLALAGMAYNKNALIAAREHDEVARDANETARLSLENQIDALQLQSDLSGSIRDRKSIALQIFALEQEIERNKLQEVIDSKTASDAERERARMKMAALNNTEAGRRDKVARDNMTPLEKYFDDIDRMGQNMNEALDDVKLHGLQSLEEGLNGIIMGTQSVSKAFRSMAASIISDLMRIAIQQAIMAPLKGMLGGLFADGGAFEGGVQKFATGGVVTRPTLFPMARGAGLMGEAGPEAIMPLKRGPNGKLGVEASGAGGGGTQNVVVNVNVEGSTQQTQGDAGKAAELGKLVANVVRAELVQQKRPGGLLA